MTLKTSSNKPPRLFGATWRYGLRKCRGQFFLYTGLMLLFLPILFMLASSAVRLNMNANTGMQLFFNLTDEYRWDLTVAYQQILIVLFMILLKPLVILFSAVFGISLFGYMHKKRSVDTFHALPVRRMPFLGASFLAGLTALAVPIVVCMLAVFLIAGSAGAFWGPMLSFVLSQLFYTLLGMIACFAFVMFMCVASGTMMDAVVSAVILSVAYPVLILLMQSFLEAVVPGYVFSVDVTVVTAFSPFVAYLLQAFWALDQMSVMTTVRPQIPLSFTVWWIFLTIVLIVTSLLLYNRRKSEYAESTYSFSPLKEIMKFLVSASSAFGLGYIASMIYQSDIVFIMFALLGAFAANTVVEALYSRGLRHFARGTITYGVFVVAFFAFYFISCFGLFGYGFTAPNVSDVQYCTVENLGSQSNYYVEDSSMFAVTSSTSASSSGISYTLETENGGYIAELNECYVGEETLEEIISLQKELAKMISGSWNALTDSYQMSHRIRFTYYLKDGSVVTRVYRLKSLYAGRAEEIAAYEQKLNEVPSVGTDMISYQILLQNVESLSVSYDDYLHGEKLDELTSLSGEAYREKREEYETKYPDLYEYESLYADWSTLTTQERNELISLLQNVTVTNDSSHYSIGSIYLNASLPQEVLDSDWIQMLAGKNDPEQLTCRVEFYFVEKDNPELVEFLRSVGDNWENP